MNDPIHAAISRIKSRIPKAILELVFNQPTNNIIRTDIDSQIKHEVINKVIRTDCDLHGGKTTTIYLNPDWIEHTNGDDSEVYSGDGGFGIYRIPPEARDMCDILEVHHILHRNYSGGSSGGGVPGHPEVQWMKGLIDSHLATDHLSTPSVELLSGDIVRLNPAPMAAREYTLVCRLSYGENFTGLNSSAIRSFVKLCEYATKRYIYQQLFINMDAGFIRGGAEYDSIKTIVESYGDMDELYDEELVRYFGRNFLDLPRAAGMIARMV